MGKDLNLKVLKKSFNLEYENYKLVNYLDLDEESSLNVLSIRNHSSIRNKMLNSNFISEKEHLDFIEKLKGLNVGYWALKKKDEILGSISLVEYNKSNKSFTAGNFVAPEKIDSGFGLVINYFMHFLAFDKLCLEKITAFIKEDNVNAIKMNDFFGAYTLNENLYKGYVYKEFLLKKWKLEVKQKTKKVLKYVL